MNGAVARGIALEGRWRSVLPIAFLTACVVGCGGSGGGTDSTGSTGSTIVSSGLVPTAPAPGSVLVTNALDHRPVVSGAVWSYRNWETGSPVSRASTTTARNSVPGSVVEVDSDDADNPVTVTVDATGGVQVAGRIALNLNMQPVAFSGYELRSPVRAGDQYVLLDRRLSTSDLDFDGDRKADTLDIAIWREVKGMEDVSVPGMTSAVNTLRVDTVLSYRTQLSSGAAPEVRTVRTSDWYARGFGIVRSARHSGTAGGGFDAQSWLSGFDSGNSGWGVTVRPIQDADAILRPTGAASDAAEVPDGLVVVTTHAIIKLGWDGRTVSRMTEVEAGWPGGGGSLISTSGGLRLIRSMMSGDRFEVYSLDDSGKLRPGQPVGQVSLDGACRLEEFKLLARTAIPRSADRIWALWYCQSTQGGTSIPSLRLQAFDLNGRSIVGPLNLPATQPSSFGVSLTTTPSSGVVASWKEQGSDIASLAQAHVDRDGSLRWSARQRFDGVSMPDYVAPIVDETGTWLAARAGFSTETMQGFGARLDSNGQFVGADNSGAGLMDERLPVLDASLLVGWPHSFVATGGRFHAMGVSYGQAYASIGAAQNYLAYTEFDAGTGRLTTGLVPARRIALPDFAKAPAVPPIVRADRVLLLTDDGLTLRPSLIWR